MNKHQEPMHFQIFNFSGYQWIIILLLILFVLTGCFGPLHEGVRAYKSGDYTRAHALWKPLAEQGDIQAQYNLGQLYAKGLGVPKNYTEAAKWYRMAAEQGDTHAQMTLSGMYSKGLGVAKDDLKSIEWHARAVEEGDTGAKFMFHLMLGNTRKGAEKGDANAQYKLGIMYSNGWGMPADVTEATKWYRKAANQGHAASKDILRTTFFVEEGICINKKYGFEAKAPKGWDVNSIAPGDKSIRGRCDLIKRGNKTTAPAISITIDLLHDYLLNNSLLDITKYMLKGLKTIEIIEQPNEVKVNTLTASRVVYKMSGIKMMFYQFRKENTIITIQLADRSSTFESNIEDFQETVSSFKFYQFLPL